MQKPPEQSTVDARRFAPDDTDFRLLQESSDGAGRSLQFDAFQIVLDGDQLRIKSNWPAVRAPFGLGMEETMNEQTTDAPHPWRIEDHGSERHGYLSIVDATGNMICDFFPHARDGGRGREATLALAVKILEWERHASAAAKPTIYDSPAPSD